MSDRTATVIVCDDLLISLQGKLTALGIFTGDISVPVPGSPIQQLVFLFIAECGLDDPFKSLTFEVTLPGQSARQHSIEVPTLIPQPDRKRWTIKVPVLVSQSILNPGRIEAKVIHDKGEIVLSPCWITVPQSAQS